MKDYAERINIVDVDRTEWAVFVESSPQASLFVSPDFLLDAGGTPKFLLALRRGLPVAGSILTDRQQRGQWFQYHSLVLSPEEHQRALRGSFAHTVAAGALFRRIVTESPFGCRFSFHPSITDLRALNWIIKELGHCPTWTTRFTGHVNLPVSRIRGTLARLIRQGTSLGIETKVTTNTDELTEVIARSEIHEVKKDIDWIEETTRHLIDRGIAKIVVASSRSDRETCAASLVVTWRDTAYTIFGGVCGKAPERRYIGPMRDDYIFRYAIESGLKIVDLMGMEGRPRAEYKSGWNSHLVLWHELDWIPS